MNITPFTAKFYQVKSEWYFNVYLNGRFYSKSYAGETKSEAQTALDNWCKGHEKSVIIL